MLRTFSLQPNEDKRLQVEGRWLIVTQATGPVELSIGGTTPITVDEKDRVHLRDLSPNDRAIRIKNVSGVVNELEIHTSDLLIDKRTAVDLQNAIEIAPDQLIGIDPGANGVQAVIRNPIELVDDQQVCINPDCNVVRVENVSLRYQPLPVVIFDATTPTVEITFNPWRAQLLLMVAPQNTNPAWAGEENQGLPLPTNRWITLDTDQGLTLSGMEGDWVYLAEMVKN